MTTDTAISQEWKHSVKHVGRLIADLRANDATTPAKQARRERKMLELADARPRLEQLARELRRPIPDRLRRGATHIGSPFTPPPKIDAAFEARRAALLKDSRKAIDAAHRNHPRP